MCFWIERMKKKKSQWRKIHRFRGKCDKRKLAVGTKFQWLVVWVFLALHEQQVIHGPLGVTIHVNHGDLKCQKNGLFWIIKTANSVIKSDLCHLLQVSVFILRKWPKSKNLKEWFEFKFFQILVFDMLKMGKQWVITIKALVF
jgi:hypothetical protein